jgi:protease-4
VVGDDRTKALIEELAIADSVNSGQSMALGPRLRER